MHRRLALLSSHLRATTTPKTTSTTSLIKPSLPPPNGRPFTATTTSNMSSSSEPRIHLYTQQTPNGIKPSILLEELGLPYKTTEIRFGANEQKQPWFLEINPNGRIPALTDSTPLPGEDEEAARQRGPVRVFESGAILQYLVERYDTEHKLSYPAGTREHWEVVSWLMWQMGGLGPMQGQSNHFFRYAPTKIPYAIDRYLNETKRLYSVMETQLAKSASGYLVGDRCTIADISCWGWVAIHDWSGVPLDEFPHLKSWLFKMLERPGVEKGRHVPSRHTAFDNANLTDEEKEKQAAESRKWILGEQK